MEFIAQTLDEILEHLSALEVDWKDDVARNVIERLRRFPVKEQYTTADVKALLDADFREGKLICGLARG